MTTNVMDAKNRRVTSDSRWSIECEGDLYCVDDTAFDKIAARPSAVMICAGNALLIQLWKAWFARPNPAYILPQTHLTLPNGTLDSITLTILKKPDFTIDFTSGLYDSFEDAARFAGTGAPFAKDCYSMNGCSLRCVESAKIKDPKTGGEVKFYDFDSSANNLSREPKSLEDTLDQLVNRGMIMDKKTGNVVPMNQTNKDALKTKLCAGSIALSAPTGQKPRAWTEREKEDVKLAMQRIVEREEIENC